MALHHGQAGAPYHGQPWHCIMARHVHLIMVSHGIASWPGMERCSMGQFSWLILSMILGAQAGA